MAASETDTDKELEDDAAKGAVRATGLTAAVAILFLLLRLLAVSDWNWDTASEVLETINIDDSVSILFGTLFAVPEIAGVLVSVLLPLAVVNLVRLSKQSGLDLGAILLVVVLTVTAIALVKTFEYFWIPAAILIVGAAIVTHEKLQDKREGSDVVFIAVKKVGLVALAVLLVLAATVRTPWTPEERITTKTGTVTGYVLDTESGYLKVLKSSDREIDIVLTSDVESRAPIR